mgnify:CR=1 FL=1
MAKLLKLRRGTTSQHSSFTGAEGEVTVDTDKESLVVHNGSQAGGFPLLRQDLSNLPAGTIDNSDVNSSAAIAGTKISPNFGSQEITTSGNIRSTGNGGTISVGDNNDLFITHTNNGLIDCNTGDLTIQTQNAMQLKTADAELGIQLVKHGAVQLYHDAAGPKLETTSTGIAVTGGITATSLLNFNSTGNEKIVLGGSSSPYIRWREGSTDKAYIQWDSSTNPGELILVNQESSDYLRIGSGGSGLKWTADGSNSTVWHSGNDGNGSTLDADLLDGKHDTSFLRSDAGGGSGSYNATSDITFSGGAGAVTIAAGSDIQMVNGNWTGEQVGKIQYHSNKHYLQSTSGVQFRDAAGAAILEISNTAGCTGKALTFSQDVNINGGSGGLTIVGSSDVQFNSGNWTGEKNGKIQNNGNILYIQGGTHNDYDIAFRKGGTGTDQWYIMSSGELRPGSNNTMDIGNASQRVRNIYTNDLHLSNKDSSNDVDGTWGDWTIQEGESDLFLKNNRSGKKFKFNLTEVN